MTNLKSPFTPSWPNLGLHVLARDVVTSPQHHKVRLQVKNNAPSSFPSDEMLRRLSVHHPGFPGYPHLLFVCLV